MSPLHGGRDGPQTARHPCRGRKPGGGGGGGGNQDGPGVSVRVPVSGVEAAPENVPRLGNIQFLNLQRLLGLCVQVSRQEGDKLILILTEYFTMPESRNP